MAIIACNEYYRKRAQFFLQKTITGYLMMPSRLLPRNMHAETKKLPALPPTTAVETLQMFIIFAAYEKDLSPDIGINLPVLFDVTG
jgi:hypothetical protein